MCLTGSQGTPGPPALGPQMAWAGWGDSKERGSRPHGFSSQCPWHNWNVRPLAVVPVCSSGGFRAHPALSRPCPPPVRYQLRYQVSPPPPAGTGGSAQAGGVLKNKRPGCRVQQTVWDHSSCPDPVTGQRDGASHWPCRGPSPQTGRGWLWASNPLRGLTVGRWFPHPPRRGRGARKETGVTGVAVALLTGRLFVQLENLVWGDRGDQGSRTRCR